ncbi:iron-sulfur cluster biosynthesis family protein, partial [Ochrobactrum sp. SFR4]
MGRFAIMTLTDAAAERVREIQASHEDALGIRVGVKKGGCAGMEYTIALAEEAK